MTGGPLKQGRIGVPISFPVVGMANGLSATRGIVVVAKPSGAQQEWACTVASGASEVRVELVHVTEAGDLDESGKYGWTAYLYDGPDDATDRIHESVDVAEDLRVAVPLTTVPS